jgi:hypothetical protein
MLFFLFFFAFLFTFHANAVVTTPTLRRPPRAFFCFCRAPPLAA